MMNYVIPVPLWVSSRQVCILILISITSVIAITVQEFILFFRKLLNKVTLGQVQFKGFPGTLRVTTFTVSSNIFVEHMVNILPLTPLNLDSSDMYYVVATYNFV